jgi:hypothetical protein
MSMKTARRSRRILRRGSTAALATLVAGVGAVVTGSSQAYAAPAAPSFGAAIDGYQPYDGQDTCDETEKPGVADFQNLVHPAYPGTGRGYIVRPCEVGDRSEHKEGRAWDWPVSAFTQAHHANDLLNWLLATDQHGNRHALARRFGIMYIIWDRRIWKSYEANQGWQPYSCSGVTDCHQDHVHVSFSWAGALRRTSWWDGGTAPRPIGTQTVGFWGRGDGSWHLTNDNNGPSDTAFVWGPSVSSNYVPLTGDWNNDGKDTIGFWNRADGSWHLTNDNSGTSDSLFVWGPSVSSNIVPLTGDWDGDGKDTVGFWNRADGSWHLTNDNQGPSDSAFVWGPAANADVTPIVGDWDNDGKDTVGFWNRRDGSWHLTNDNQGPSDSAFVWGPANSAAGRITPLTGDWNGDGKDTIGFWNRADGSWHLTNDNQGPSDSAFVWGPAGSSATVPIVGDWNGV